MESHDMIFEVLSRATLQTLGKCRLLSKECNNLTYESSFMRHHTEITKIISGFFVQSLKKNKHTSTFVSSENNFSETKSITLDFLPYPAKIEACTKQGIMLCSSQYPHETSYYICKPSTKQYEVLPNPNLDYFTETMAMVGLGTSTLRYKLVRLSKSELNSGHSLKCETFDSRQWMWKQLEDVNLPFYEFLINSKPVVSVCGALHWITSEKRVFSFDMKNQSWELFSLPETLCQGDEYSRNIELVEYEGKLGLIYLKEKYEVELWVMEKYMKKVWSKKYSMDMKDFEEDSGACVEAFYNSDVALIRGFYELIFYRFKNGRSRDVVKVDEHMFPTQVFLFQSDSELVDLRKKVVNSSASSTVR